MTTLQSLLLLICAFSNTGQQESHYQTKCGSAISPDTMHVELNNECIVVWDFDKEDIASTLEDGSFLEINKDRNPTAKSLIHAIADTTSLGFNVFYKENAPLRKGDLAFMILDKEDKIPVAILFDVQFDLIWPKVRYQRGIFEFLEDFRAEIVKVLLDFNSDYPINLGPYDETDLKCPVDYDKCLKWYPSTHEE